MGGELVLIRDIQRYSLRDIIRDIHYAEDMGDLLKIKVSLKGLGDKE